MGAVEKTTYPGLLANPASGAETVTPSNTDELVTVSRGLWVGGAGDLSVLMQDGTTGVFNDIPAGTLLPIRIKRVNSTGTTATLMTSIY